MIYGTSLIDLDGASRVEFQGRRGAKVATYCGAEDVERISSFGVDLRRVPDLEPRWPALADAVHLAVSDERLPQGILDTSPEAQGALSV